MDEDGGLLAPKLRRRRGGDEHGKERGERPAVVRNLGVLPRNRRCGLLVGRWVVVQRLSVAQTEGSDGRRGP